MIQGILGKKLGMSQIFAMDGRRIPVTVVEGGGDLTAPIWTDAGLQVADMGEGGAARLLPASDIEAQLGG